MLASLVVGFVLLAAAWVCFEQTRVTLRQSGTLDFLDRHGDGWRVRIGVWAEVVVGFSMALALVVFGVLLIAGVIAVPTTPDTPAPAGTTPGR